MQAALGITRVLDAGGEPFGDAQPLLDLAQDQQTTIRGEAPTIETGHERLADDG